MNYTVYTSALSAQPFNLAEQTCNLSPFTVDAVSPQDAALKVATRLASRTIIPHGEPITLAAIPTLDHNIADYTRVVVTPLGRTWGSIEERREQREVAALVNEWTKVAV